MQVVKLQTTRTHNLKNMFITPSFLLIALAVYMAVVLIPAILYPKKFITALREIMESIPNLRILGFVIMIVSFLFLSVHWKLNGGWFILIPIFGWLSFAKGVMFLIFPKTMQKSAKKFFLKSETVLTIASFVALLIAIGITYVALYIY